MNTWAEASWEPLKGFAQGVRIQRDDLIHAVVSGNKSRKLAGWLRLAREQGAQRLVSMGGAYSNHMIALASAASDAGFAAAVYVRGEEERSNLYLDYARSQGMEIWPISREEYRQLRLTGPTQLEPGDLFIPEGGAGQPAYEGFENLVQAWPSDLEWVLHASATATTAIGLGKALQKARRNTQVLAVAVLKNANEQRQMIAAQNLTHVSVWEQAHFGGYAKTPPELLRYWKEAEAKTGLVLDPVYTAKALWALEQGLKEQALTANGMFLHTGGIWGGQSERYRDRV